MHDPLYRVGRGKKIAGIRVALETLRIRRYPTSHSVTANEKNS